jgi:hypothetical protein
MTRKMQINRRFNPFNPFFPRYPRAHALISPPDNKT